MPDLIDVAKLFASGQLKFKKGEIEFLQQDVVMVPVDWIITLQKRLENQNSENLIYYTGKEIGVRWFKGLYDKFKISWEDVFKWGMNTVSVAGWGETSIPEINSKDKLFTVKLEKSAGAKGFGKVGYAVDNFIRGAYASGGNVLFGVECDGIELTCESEGAPFCKFLVQPTNRFDKKDPRVMKQLKLPKI